MDLCLPCSICFVYVAACLLIHSILYPPGSFSFLSIYFPSVYFLSVYFLSVYLPLTFNVLSGTCSCFVSVLEFRCSHYQPVQFLSELNLTRQS